MVMAVLGTTPSILLGFMKYLAKFKLIFVDMFGLAYLIGTSLSIVTLLLTDWIQISAQEKIRLDLNFSFFYVVSVGLLNSNFLFNLIGRSLVYTICQGIVLVTRMQNGEADILASVFLHMCAMLLLEIIFYVQ